MAVARLPKLALPLEIFPVTLKLVNVPTLVMFGWALVVNLPVNDVAVNVPVSTLNANPALAL